MPINKESIPYVKGALSSLKKWISRQYLHCTQTEDIWISGWNLHWKGKGTFYWLQEILNEISFLRFLEQVDGKIWRVHHKLLAATIFKNRRLRVEREDECHHHFSLLLIKMRRPDPLPFPFSLSILYVFFSSSLLSKCHSQGTYSPTCNHPPAHSNLRLYPRLISIQNCLTPV